MGLEAGGLQELGEGGLDGADAAAAEEGAVDAVSEGRGEGRGTGGGDGYGHFFFYCLLLFFFFAFLEGREW